MKLIKKINTKQAKNPKYKYPPKPILLSLPIVIYTFFLYFVVLISPQNIFAILKIVIIKRKNPYIPKLWILNAGNIK